MTLNELYQKAKKMVEEGHGEAILVFTDTRSGVSERCHLGSVDVVVGSEQDFYADLEVGDKYVSIYEGG